MSDLDSAIRRLAAHVGRRSSAEIQSVAASLSQESTRDLGSRLAALLVAGGPITLAYDAVADTLTISSAYPALEGLTAGQLLRATGATSAAFATPQQARIDSTGSGGQVVSGSTYTTVTLPHTAADPAGIKVGNTLRPSVAGTYLVITSIIAVSITSGRALTLFATRNGVSQGVNELRASATGQLRVAVTALVSVNGTTDTISLIAYHDDPAGVNLWDGQCYLQALWVSP